MDDAIATANGGAEEGEELASQERAKAAPRKRNARGQPVAEGLAPLHVDLATLLASGGQQPKAGLLCLIRTCPSRSKGVCFANTLLMKKHLKKCAERCATLLAPVACWTCASCWLRAWALEQRMARRCMEPARAGRRQCTARNR